MHWGFRGLGLWTCKTGHSMDMQFLLGSVCFLCAASVNVGLASVGPRQLCMLQSSDEFVQCGALIGALKVDWAHV